MNGSRPIVTDTLEQRLERLRVYTESTRYALTEDDVRWDYETGHHRYAPKVTGWGLSDEYLIRTDLARRES